MNDWTHLVQGRPLGAGQGCHLGAQGWVLEEWEGPESAARQRGRPESVASVSCCWKWSEGQVFQAEMQVEVEEEAQEVAALFLLVEEHPIVSVQNIDKIIVSYVLSL